MFERLKILPPDAFGPEMKHDRDMWLWKMERDVNHFFILCVDGMVRPNSATCLLRGDANTWWHYVHVAFHAGPSATWANFHNIFLSPWQVVLLEGASRDN